VIAVSSPHPWSLTGEIHFLYGDKADALMHAVRHLIGRAGPSAMETKVLMGLARQIRWFVREARDPRRDTKRHDGRISE
jgi:tRNA C32,U32 (ribose-2'-O)-methylase TrmJ